MQACFYSNTAAHSWYRELFKWTSPTDIPLAGRSGCLHAIDVCSKLAVTDVLVADCHYSEELARKLGNGSYWSLKLTYIKSGEYSNPMELLAHQNVLSDKEDILFFWGRVLPKVGDTRRITSELHLVQEPGGALPLGLYLLRQGKLYRCVCPLFLLDTLRNYFDNNFDMLKKPGIYVPFGYSQNKAFGIGTNVAIMPNCNIKTPVIIHNNVVLERGVAIKGGAIIASNVFIDEQTEIRHSLVMSNTYIGRKMSIENKIVDGNRVIDPFTGAYVDITEDFLVSDFYSIRKDGYWPLEWLLALVIGIVGLLPFMLALPFRKLLARTSFFAYMFSIYPKIWKVIVFQAQLVRYGKGNVDYAYRYSDLYPLHTTEQQKEMDDTYFVHHKSLSLILTVIFGAPFKKMLLTTAAVNEGETASADD